MAATTNVEPVPDAGTITTVLDGGQAAIATTVAAAALPVYGLPSRTHRVTGQEATADALGTCGASGEKPRPCFSGHVSSRKFSGLTFFSFIHAWLVSNAC